MICELFGQVNIELFGTEEVEVILEGSLNFVQLKGQINWELNGSENLYPSAILNDPNLEAELGLILELEGCLYTEKLDPTATPTKTPTPTITRTPTMTPTRANFLPRLLVRCCTDGSINAMLPPELVQGDIIEFQFGTISRCYTVGGPSIPNPNYVNEYVIYDDCLECAACIGEIDDYCNPLNPEYICGTATPTPTPTLTPTKSLTPTPTVTITPTITPSFTPTPTRTPDGPLYNFYYKMSTGAVPMGIQKILFSPNGTISQSTLSITNANYLLIAKIEAGGYNRTNELTGITSAQMIIHSVADPSKTITVNVSTGTNFSSYVRFPITSLVYYYNEPPFYSGEDLELMIYPL
jgi:hypothetical protein